MGRYLMIDLDHPESIEILSSPADLRYELNRAIEVVKPMMADRIPANLSTRPWRYYVKTDDGHRRWFAVCPMMKDETIPGDEYDQRPEVEP